MRLTPTGNIQNWMLFCRILDKMNKDPEYSAKLGLKDLSSLGPDSRAFAEGNSQMPAAARTFKAKE